MGQLVPTQPDSSDSSTSRSVPEPLHRTLCWVFSVLASGTAALVAWGLLVKLLWSERDYGVGDLGAAGVGVLLAYAYRVFDSAVRARKENREAEERSQQEAAERQRRAAIEREKSVRRYRGYRLHRQTAWGEGKLLLRAAEIEETGIADVPEHGGTDEAAPTAAARGIDRLRDACWGVDEVEGEPGDEALGPLPVVFLHTADDVSYVLKLIDKAQARGRYILAERALNDMEEALSAATRSTELDPTPEEMPSVLADDSLRDHVALELSLARARLNAHTRRWWDGLGILLGCLRRCGARPQGDELRIWAEVHELMADVRSAVDAPSHLSAPAEDAWG